MIQSASGTVYDNVTIFPMIRYVEITDNTYEPYTPSLQEQIDALLVRIETLEGQQPAQSGG